MTLLQLLDIRHLQYLLKQVFNKWQQLLGVPALSSEVRHYGKPRNSTHDRYVEVPARGRKFPNKAEKHFVDQLHSLMQS